MRGSLNYGEFILSDEQNMEKRNEENDKNQRRQELIKQFVMKNGYVKLKCDYLGMDSYYYDTTRKIMYKVCNICDWTGDVIPKFEISNDEHILRLNSIKQ